VIRAVWTADNIDFDGKHFSARGITAHPRPVSEPHPPIWIGGNPGAARRRAAEKGDGWGPFAAPPQLAQTARTAAIDSIEALADGIDDLRRRLDKADRDPSTIDIVFGNFEGGSPADDDFNADAYLTGLERLAKLGVNWIQVGLPGDSLAHALEVLDRFKTRVVDAL
jgi:alkanesulfonate monooxygenase SsuD/methylene tetrahydromethanopterin reductase-like flavin-dependent oxidoreductase (luciferase family)